MHMQLSPAAFSAAALCRRRSHRAMSFAQTRRVVADQGPGEGEPQQRKVKSAGGKVNLFDPAATLSRFLTRRFGIVGGLSLVAVLAATEGYSIFEALKEDFAPTGAAGEPVTTATGLVFQDLKVGGGSSPAKGDFVGMNLFLSIPDGDGPGKVLLNTKETGRPVAFKFLLSRGGAVCKGVEEGVATMHRGGIRQLDVPPALAFGDAGTVLPNGAVVPPGTTLRYVVTLEEVSPAYF